MKVLIVVDMQNDFIDGALGTQEAVAIVPKVAEKIQTFDGTVIFTKDTHKNNYLETQEGKLLPVEHCICGQNGWELNHEIQKLCHQKPIEKPTFGSIELGQRLQKLNSECRIESITFIGLCTDICVISNALIAKAVLPETPIIVDSTCCAGVTPQSHQTALNAMAMCQIQII